MLSFRVNLSVAVVAMTTNQTHHLPNGTTTEASKVKQIQTNANANTKSGMTKTSTNETHHSCKGTTTEALKHKTKHKQCVFSSTHFRDKCQQIFFKTVKASNMFHISREIFAFL